MEGKLHSSGGSLKTRSGSAYVAAGKRSRLSEEGGKKKSISGEGYFNAIGASVLGHARKPYLSGGNCFPSEGHSLSSEKREEPRTCLARAKKHKKHLKRSKAPSPAPNFHTGLHPDGRKRKMPGKKKKEGVLCAQERDQLVKESMRHRA